MVVQQKQQINVRLKTAKISIIQLIKNVSQLWQVVQLMELNV